MLEFTYYGYYLNSKDVSEVRLGMVQFARLFGVKPAARQFATTPKTVRKWIRRFEEREQLLDHTRRPARSPRRIKPYWRFKIIDLCRQMEARHQRINATMLRRQNGIPYSLPTVLKVMREEGFFKQRGRSARQERSLAGHH